MIITRLNGGLGNQMFQYAAAKRLAWIRDTDVVIDVSEFAYDPQRNYCLNHFSLPQVFVTADDLWWIRRLREKNPMRKLLYRVGGWIRPAREMTLAREPHFHFSGEMLQLPDNTCLDGYWQSERYFADATDVIRSAFIIKDPLLEQNRAVLESIERSESIALHVRRGDYVTNPTTYEVHGVCSSAYYEACIAYITERVNKPHFFLFSDDPEWVKENLCLQGQTTVIENNPAIEDMRLMSRCKHNIIANSSFSWWGAWLNTNTNKMVLAPRRWFQDSAIDTSDLYPTRWIVL